MNKIIAYFKESTDELVNKVTWPTWAQLQSSALLVMVAALLIAVLVYAMDASSGSLIRLIYGI